MSALCGLSILYSLGATVHRGLYDAGILRKTRLPVPVIGVGNLSFGGSGKTLLTACLARKLAGEGRRVGVICRSYRAADGPHLLNGGYLDPYVVGDEAAMLYSDLVSGPACGVSIASGRDKTEAARLLADRTPKFDVLIVDDAFQHHRLAQDVRILIWPGPNAALRERRSVAATADLLLVPNGMRSPRPDADTIYFVKEFVGLERRPKKILLGPGPELGKFILENRILAVAGLGPETDFFDRIRSWRFFGSDAAHWNPESLAELRLPDHVDYRESAVRSAVLRGSDRKTAILTTAKDHVKLHGLADRLPPIYVVRSEIRILTNAALFWGKIHSAIPAKGV